MAKKKAVAKKDQYVCTVCGYNMIGYYPEKCPFCGAERATFLTAEEVSQNYRVVKTRVSDTVTMLRSDPPLGFEHAAYRIETGDSICWVDCPSTFDDSLGQVDLITYTHHHFLGAGNLYRQHLGARLAIHWQDSRHDLCRGYEFDRLFDPDLAEKEPIESGFIDGHTPGFTFYCHEDILLLCDYVFYNKQRAKFNPYGPAVATRRGGEKLLGFLKGRRLRLVCGFDYVADFDDWRAKFNELLGSEQSLPAAPKK